MKTLLGVLREIAFGVGVLVLGIIAGNILYRIIADLLPAAGMDRSADAASGAGILFGLVVLVAHLFRRLARRKTSRPVGP